MIISRVVPVKKPRKRKWIVDDLTGTCDTGMFAQLKESRKTDHSGPLSALIAHLATIPPTDDEISLDKLYQLRIFRNECIEFHLQHDRGYAEYHWKAINKKVVNEFLRYFDKVTTKKKRRNKCSVQLYGFTDKKYGKISQIKKPNVLAPLTALVEHLAALRQTTPEISMEELGTLTIWKDKYIVFIPQPPNMHKYQQFKWSDVDTKFINALIENCKPKLSPYNYAAILEFQQQINN